MDKVFNPFFKKLFVEIKVISKRISWTPFLLVFILGASLLLRFAAYDHPIGYHGGEGVDDYVIASHALSSGEWPVLGTYNGTFPSLGNSPIYYYVIIAFASLYNSMDFVNLCFIVLGALSIVGVFGIAKRLFGDIPAVIAASLYAVAPYFVENYAYFIWQPFIMEPVLILGVYFLVKGYQEASENILTLSLIVTISAFALHQSVLGFLPLYLFLLYFALFRLRGIKGLVLPTLIGGATLFVLFSPLLFASHAGYVILGEPSLTQNLSAMFGIQHLLAVIPEVFSILAFRLGIFSIPFLGVIFPILAGWFFLRKDISGEKKFFLVVLLLFVIQQSFAAAVAGLGVQDRHAIPANWALVISLAVVVYETLLRPQRIAPVGILLGVLCVFSIFSTSFIQHSLANIPQFERPRQVLLRNAVQAVERKVELLRKDDNFQDYLFFNIVGRRTRDLYVSPEIFWEPLERRLKTQFTHFQSTAHEYINQKYVFLFCTQGLNSAFYPSDACLKFFTDYYPAYVLQENVFEDPILSVYLAKKESR